MLRCVRRHIIRDDDLIRNILRVLQNRKQARIGVVDLVVYRNDDGNRRVLHPFKFQASMLPVNLTDVEIAVP